MESSDPELRYLLALALIPEIGPLKTRKILDQFGSAQMLFRYGLQALKELKVLSEASLEALDPRALLSMAEKELEVMDRGKIRATGLEEEDYPDQLKQCPDAPVLLFSKGAALPLSEPCLSVVGTRKATSYGRDMCQRLISGLSELTPGLTIVSGMAYGIDIMAHRAALKSGLRTIGVLGNGLDSLYPPRHHETAVEMLEKGGLLSELTTGIGPKAANFHRRNRLIAGLSSATLVVESAIRGGSHITARLASDYSRDVLAVPGRTDDLYSAGCNALIRDTVAALVESPEDIINKLNWDKYCRKAGSRADSRAGTENDDRDPAEDLGPEAGRVLGVLRDSSPEDAGSLSLKCKLKVGTVSSILVRLEMLGLVRREAGDRYFPSC